MAAVASIRSLSKIYRKPGTNVEVAALRSVSIDFEEGEYTAIMGASGSGKSTMMNMIGLLDTPTDGRVALNGRDMTRASRREQFALRRHTVSFIFQTFNLFPGLTAVENVEFGGDVAGRQHALEVSREVLTDVGLADRMDHFPHQLSGGEQQRVAIARALATDNPILLADEPTGELDFHTGVQILTLLQAQADAGRAVLVVTHNREIARVADRIVELSDGRIVSDAPPSEGRTPVAELRW